MLYLTNANGGSAQAGQNCSFGCQTAPAAIILKKRCVLELPRLPRPPFKRDASSNPEALNVHYENLLSFQILHNYNHRRNDNAS